MCAQVRDGRVKAPCTVVPGGEQEVVVYTDQELEARYAFDQGRLANRYEGVFTPEEVAHAFQISREHLEKQATMRDFLPLLVSRMTVEELTAFAQAEGRVSKARPEILFVSENNNCRSHMAAAITQHLSGGQVNVRCAGLHPQGGLSREVVTVLRERGIELKNPFPMPFTPSLLGAADFVVTMGAEEFHEFPGKRWREWDVPPIAGQGIERVRAVADDLERRVATLLDEVALVAA